ncbi:MAG: TSUP family transporter [Campylobacteraceae bacterium]|nr:TSUP family transporter [Campylobacteraceae bacterium]
MKLYLQRICVEFELVTFLIVCPLVFLAGFIDAIAGGGGLISMPAYLFAGLPPHYALGTNKLSSTIGAIVASLRYYKNGFVDMAICFPSIICALMGSFIGAHIALHVNEEILQKILIILLPIIAIYILKNKSLNVAINSIPRKKTLIYSTIISFAVGMYDGFFGPGTGTFLIIAFIGIARIAPRTAAGNAKIINLSSNIAGLSVFLYNGYVSIALGLIAGIFSIFGSYMGAGLAIKKGSNIIRYAIFFVITLLFCKLAWDIVFQN